jgi:HAD superfamily hydrolase (TIGR01509 family)
MKYKAAVFDMDGVLIDTEKVYRLCWKANGISIGIPEGEMDGVCDRVAGGNRESNGRVFKELLGEDFDYLAFRAKTMDMFEDYVNEHGIELKPGVVNMLNLLRDKGIKIALATSTDRIKANRRLTEVGILDYFDETVCGDEIANGKPKPDVYLKACEKLGVSPSDTIAFEDSINGVVSAHTAGLYTVMVVDLVKPNETTREMADRTYDSMTDAAEIFSE